MPTIIQRRSVAGPSIARRAPFPTPGRDPEVRLSVLSLQGNNGAAVPTWPNIGALGSTGPFTPGANSAPTMNVIGRGHPTVQFEAQPTNRSLQTAGNVGIVRTFLGVIIPGVLPTSGAMHIARGGVSDGAMSISIHADGRFMVFGTGTVGQSPNVTVTPYAMHFVAGVINGSSSIVQVDDKIATVSTSVPTSSLPLILGAPLSSSAGVRSFAVLDLEAHTSVLAQAELDEKREHYRTLYQF